MTIKTVSTISPVRRWRTALVLLIVAVSLCISVMLWFDFAPHYLPLDKIDALGANEWSTSEQTLITTNGNRFSVWVGEIKVCDSQLDTCHYNDQSEMTRQLANWFLQHGWEAAQRDPATGWNVCDNLSIAKKRSDLVFEQQDGWYYKPTACVTVEPDSVTSLGFTIHATTINPAPLTMWSD